uniref:Uncharacterized protein n=1 Tax=Spongospora subterranea TaxID=70186 RepID=A0A0H5QVS6_9EUKA|eukprot:CRZ06020.1 hypothetical protein [Spongospora subterranea]
MLSFLNYARNNENGTPCTCPKTKPKGKPLRQNDALSIHSMTFAFNKFIKSVRASPGLGSSIITGSKFPLPSIAPCKYHTTYTTFKGIEQQAHEVLIISLMCRMSSLWWNI